ncbi:geranylgeranyl transferase type-2 subunit alpha [Enteropsectra breve]|nr:geranylgeranyl transferase type-2 subunit alpha [Enteropsectra breve]
MIRHGVLYDTEAEDENAVKEILEVQSMKDSEEKWKRMVVLNPDDYRCWNLLKEKYLHSDGMRLIMKEYSEKAISEMLKLTQDAIEANPKSYFPWHHRLIFITLLLEHNAEDVNNRELSEKMLAREKRLCNILLQMDPRNFHCWNYLRMIKIEMPCDFSNFSSLQNYSDYSNDIVFTDPHDEGSWRYLDKVLANSRRGLFHVRDYGCYCEIVFCQVFNGSVSYKMLGATEETAAKIGPCLVHRISCSGVSSISPVIRIKGNEYALVKERLPAVIDEILELEPECTHALVRKLSYVNERSERNEIVDRLSRIDPMRREYYESLKKECFVIFSAE